MAEAQGLWRGRRRSGRRGRCGEGGGEGGGKMRGLGGGYVVVPVAKAEEEAAAPMVVRAEAGAGGSGVEGRKRQVRWVHVFAIPMPVRVSLRRRGLLGRGQRSCADSL